MTRWSLGTLLATIAAGPWGGCERDPLTPPASPPPERAPFNVVQPELGGIIVISDAHGRG